MTGIGIHPALSMQDYHALDAWGSSSLRAFRRGPPARVLWERSNDVSSKAISLGSAVHCRLLEPDAYFRRFAHKPEKMSFATKEGKAWREEHSGLEILDPATWLAVSRIHKALTDKEAVSHVLKGASHKEASIVWRCATSAELCKARPDILAGHWLFDLKVSRHADGRSLAYRAFVEGWMHQLAHYRTGAILSGLDIRGGRLIVVSPSEPHFVHLLEVKTEALNLLELENLETLRLMGECRRKGEWPGTPDTWTKIEPPPTALVETGSILDTMTEVEL